MKRFFILIFLVFTSFFISSTVSVAQDMEEWVWETRQITFLAIDDMKVIVNESEEFEAENEHISMYYKAMDFGDRSYDELSELLIELAEELGMDDSGRMDMVSAPNIDGHFITGKINNDHYVTFVLGNKLQNALIIGIIQYKQGWENTAVEMVRGIYMD